MFVAKALDLSKALSLILVSAEQKTTMPALSYALFQGIPNGVRLTGTDIDSTIETQIEADSDEFAWCVPAKKLADLIRLISGDVTISEFEERILVKSGSTEHRLPILPREAFPAIESAQITIGEISGSLLSEMLTLAMIGAETNPNGVDWQKNIEVVAKDGTLTITGCSNARISSVSTRFGGEFEAVIPNRAAKILATFAESAEKVSIACSNNLLSLRTETGAAHSRLSAHKMGDWRQAINVEYHHKIELDSEATLLTLRRALLASDNGAVDISLRKDQALLTANDVDGKQRGSEQLAIDCPTLNGKSYDLRVTGEHLIDFLRFSKPTAVWQIGERADGHSYLRFALKEPREFDWLYIPTTRLIK